MSPDRAREERSAGGVVVRRIDGLLHVLVIRDPYRNWGLPKGHLEQGETSRQAAVREVREETGLREVTLGPEIGTIDWWFRNDGRLIHKFCDFYLMASPVGQPRPEFAEGITATEWVPLDAVVERITYGNAQQIVRQALEILDGDGMAALPFGP